MNRTVLVLMLAFLLFGISAAQEEPFKKYPALPALDCGGWSDSTFNRAQSWEDSDTIEAVLPCVFPDHDTCRIIAFAGVPWKTTRIQVFRNKLMVQEFHSDSVAFVSTHFALEPIVVADFNGDNLPDIRILGGIWGNSWAGGYRIIYLLQDSSHYFTEISYYGKEKHAERVVDNSRVAVVTTGLNSVAGHSYFTYYLYKFSGTDLIDVSKKYGYPIFIQLLYRENHQPARNIPDSIIRRYLRSKPPEYMKDRGVIY